MSARPSPGASLLTPLPPGEGDAKRRVRDVLLALILTSCSTSRSANEAPFTPGTPIGQVHAIRELMRVRATHGERTESFRAQLLVEPATRRIELTAYTPLGTSAMTLFADGDRVTFLNHVDRTAWEGSAQSLDFFGGQAPAAWALAVLGYPSSGTSVAYDPAT